MASEKDFHKHEVVKEDGTLVDAIINYNYVQAIFPTVVENIGNVFVFVLANGEKWVVKSTEPVMEQTAA